MHAGGSDGTLSGSGTSTMTAANGDQLNGTFTVSGSGPTLRVTKTINGGTGRFADTTGTLDVVCTAAGQPRRKPTEHERDQGIAKGALSVAAMSAAMAGIVPAASATPVVQHLNFTCDDGSTFATDTVNPPETGGWPQRYKIASGRARPAWPPYSPGTTPTTRPGR